MTHIIYFLLGWLVFIALVYAYMYYDVHATELQLHDKWIRLRDAITEEE